VVIAEESPKIDARFAEGLRLLRGGDFSGSECALREALALDPGSSDGWYLLGRACQELGKLEDAVTAHERALLLNPGLAEAHNNLGMVLRKLGRVGEAIISYREALQLRPDYAEARNNLGNALAAVGEHQDAILCLRQVIESRPDYAEAHNNLGVALNAQGRWREAAASLRDAIRLRPDFGAAYSNLGLALVELGDDERALGCFERALTFSPGLEEALSGRASLMGRRGDFEVALALFDEAVRMNPRSAQLWGNRGYFLAEQGRIDLGLESYRQAIREGPASKAMRSNYLFFLNYDPAVSAGTLLEAHRMGARVFGTLAPPSFDGYDRSSGRPLRVGYVSPDFRRHAVAYFIEPILANHDRRRVESIGYADVGSPDGVTARLRSLAHDWRETSYESDDRLYELIRRDRIDILVDLAGHTARNRLCVFARRPAPIQVTYLGYPATTGLSTIGAILTDDVVDPSGAPARCTEQPIPLPGGAYCFAPPPNAPDIAPLPMLGAGFPTFGSLHKLPKLNSHVLDLWSDLLRAIPRARLILFRDTLKGRRRQEILSHFEASGIVPERIMVRHDWRADLHWTMYSSIDVSLDVFPWCGHTTACESLWMGVPIVTLAGERRSSRMTASVLKMLDLTDLIAETPEQYIEAAARLIADPDQLARLRGDLRRRMRASRLCDGAAFTRDLETAYETLWGRWCEQTAG
jgi:predicted O-linked N-acetylglucosamine transferase (SPINDLY family)